MLIPLLAHQNSAAVAPSSEKLPTIKIDRGGGGGARWPGYDVVDIVGALRAFPEIAGEHPVVRAARRLRFVDSALPGIKEARERREAAIFLMGAAVGDRAAEERHRELDLRQMIALYDAVVEARATRSRSRGETLPSGIGLGGGLLLLGLGVGIGLAIARRRSRA